MAKDPDPTVDLYPPITEEDLARKYFGAFVMDEEKGQRMHAITNATAALAKATIQLVPPGRHQHAAIEKLEEFVAHAVGGIGRGENLQHLQVVPATEMPSEEG